MGKTKLIYKKQLWYNQYILGFDVHKYHKPS